MPSSKGMESRASNSRRRRRLGEKSARSRNGASRASRRSTSHESVMNEADTKPPARTKAKGRSGRRVMSTRMAVMLCESRKSPQVSGTRHSAGMGACQNRLNDI